MFVFSAFSYLFLLPTRSSSVLTFPTPFHPICFEERKSAFLQKLQPPSVDEVLHCMEKVAVGERRVFLFFAALHHFLSHHFCCCWRVNLNWAVCPPTFILFVYLIPSMMDLSAIVIIVAFSLVSAGEFIRVGLYKMFFLKKEIRWLEQ